MQEDFFGHFESGKMKRDKGMAQALKHAEDTEDDWGGQARKFLHQYAKTHKEFSGEMVRIASRDIIPRPPHLRAWGAIIVGGLKAGWIRQIGFTKVKTPTSHMANAAWWESCI